MDQINDIIEKLVGDIHKGRRWDVSSSVWYRGTVDAQIVSTYSTTYEGTTLYLTVEPRSGKHILCFDDRAAHRFESQDTPEVKLIAQALEDTNYGKKELSDVFSDILNVIS
jgi:hypothetical protein